MYDMKQINYTQIGEHFSSNVKTYDKAKEIEIAKDELIDKIGYLLEIVPFILGLLLSIFAMALAIGISIISIVGLFVMSPLWGILCMLVYLLCLSPLILGYINEWI
mgnify:CR=1 FL=1